MRKKTPPKYVWVRPGMFDPPLVGTGLISRRVIFAPYYRKVNRILPKPMHDASEIPHQQNIRTIGKKGAQQPISFKNAEVKIIFTYWQNFSHPFTKHKQGKSNVTGRAVRSIEKALKSYGRGQILSAMDKCHALFLTHNFKFKYYYEVKHLGLDEFFQYQQLKYKKISSNKGMYSLPRSWFNTCVKHSLKELGRMFTRRFKAEYPEVGRKLADIWSKYRRGIITESEEDSLKRAGDRLLKYCNSNNIELSTALNLINNMINVWHSYAPSHTGYLSSDLFLSSILPDELVRFGLIKEKEKRGIKL